MVSYESKCEFKIKLSTQKDVQDFTQTVAECPNFVGVFAGDTQLDAKSIMGMFSLDLSEPVLIIIKSKSKEHNAEEFKQTFYPWIVEVE